VSETEPTAEHRDTDLLAQLKAFEGMEIESRVAPDPVNQAMIRHWVDAMGEHNEVYTDPTAAAASVHGQIVAPPTMLGAWTMPGLRGRSRVPGAATTNAQANLLNLLDGAGFVGVVATNCEQEYDRMLHIGERLVTKSVIDSVSEEKTTGLGVGHFVTTRVEYFTVDGEPVGRELFRMLKFRPGSAERAAPTGENAGRTDGTPRPKRPRPAVTPDNRFFFEGAKEHCLLVQRCAACGTFRHPPQPRCDRCGSYEWDAVEASGRGRVYSYVVNHHPQIPAFDYPLPIALVELEEGTRLVANIVECAPDAITIDMAVEVTWIDADDDLTLPAFRPAGRAP
jgi:uncharacterized OB-fold protein